MLVLQIIDSLAPGGAERSLADLVPHLAALGVEMEFVVFHDRPGLREQVVSAGVQVDVVTGDRLQRLGHTTRKIRSRSFDLVSTTLFEADIVGRTASRLAGVPCVSTLVGTPYGPEHRAEPGIRAARLHAARLTDWSTARLARRFRAVSATVKAAYVERLHLRPGLVDVIPEGRDPDRLGIRQPERRRAARSLLQAEDDDLVILAVGRQDPPKGYDTLLRAVPHLQRLAPRVRIFVAGKPGRSSGELLRLQNELHVGDAVCFLGHRDDVPDLLAGADVFVLPSLREGIPGAVQEAMALECPIAASDIGAVREVLGDGRPAELFAPDDPIALSEAVRRVLADPQRTRRRTELARQRFLDEFGAPSVARRVLSFYETALEGAGTTGRGGQRRP